MSRIGRAPVAIPTGVKTSQEGAALLVEGPKGKLTLQIPSAVSITLDSQQLKVERTAEDKRHRAMHGLYRALIANMVHGVSTGFSRELEISGVGYRAQLQGKQVSLQVGFSHPVVVAIPEGLTVEIPKPTSVIVKGADKHLVGQFAANLRRVAPPEPYKGKGIRYAGEIVRRKAGKAATGAGAKAGGGGG